MTIDLTQQKMALRFGSLEPVMHFACVMPLKHQRCEPCQPRATPWVWVGKRQRPEGARHDGAPFQGFALFVPRDPGRCPTAIELAVCSIKTRDILSGAPRWAKAARRGVEGSRGIADGFQIKTPCGFSRTSFLNLTGSFDCAAPAFPPPLRSG